MSVNTFYKCDLCGFMVPSIDAKDAGIQSFRMAHSIEDAPFVIGPISEYGSHICYDCRSALQNYFAEHKNNPQI